MLARARQLFISKGHHYGGKKGLYWNISRGTKAMTLGRNCPMEANACIASVKHLASYRIWPAIYQSLEAVIAHLSFITIHVVGDNINWSDSRRVKSCILRITIFDDWFL